MDIPNEIDILFPSAVAPVARRFSLQTHAKMANLSIA